MSPRRWWASPRFRYASMESRLRAMAPLNASMATNVWPRLERLVTLADEPLIFAIALDRLVGQQAGQRPGRPAR